MEKHEKDSSRDDIYSLMRQRNICVCRFVSEETIKGLIAKGIVDIEEIIQITGATTGCGTCYPKIQKLIKDQTNHG